MAYNNFTLDVLIQQFGLRVEARPDAFADAVPVALSPYLRETLAETVPLALDVSTEKVRSELIISPVLMEARRQFKGQISLFSGVDFTVEPEAGLSGICDFCLVYRRCSFLCRLLLLPSWKQKMTILNPASANALRN